MKKDDLLDKGRHIGLDAVAECVKGGVDNEEVATVWFSMVTTIVEGIAVSSGPGQETVKSLMKAATQAGLDCATAWEEKHGDELHRLRGGTTH